MSKQIRVRYKSHADQYVVNEIFLKSTVLICKILRALRDAMKLLTRVSLLKFHLPGAIFPFIFILEKAFPDKIQCSK